MNKSQLRLPIDDFEVTAGIWRPIHYLGSKLRLVEPLRLALDQVDPGRGRVVDLFAGSGTVSAALAGGRDVTAVDIQEYSRVLCSAILNPAHVSDTDTAAFLEAVRQQARANLRAGSPLIEYEESCLSDARAGDPEPVCQLIEHASMVTFNPSEQPMLPAFVLAQKRAGELIGTGDKTTLILRFYGGLFFSYRQAAEIDALLTIAHTKGGLVREFLLAAIISTASEVVNTVGKHFAQPIRPRGSDGKPKRHIIAKIIRDRETDLLSLFVEWLDRYRSLMPTRRAHEVVRADYASALSQLEHVGVVYADPPYTRDHYSRFYHVLETMCLWDDPGISTTRIRAVAETHSRGMYRADRHQSPFCIKSQAPGAFEKLFAAVKKLNAPLILSYSPYASGDAHPRVMGIEQIASLAAKYFKQVETTSVGKFSHVKLNAAHLHLEASSEAELIFLCR